MNVLIIDDEYDVARSAADALRAKGCQVTIPADPDETAVALKQGVWDAVVSDFELWNGPDVNNGVTLLYTVWENTPKERRSQLKLVLRSGSPEKAQEGAKGLDAVGINYAFLAKPHSNTELYRAMGIE